LLESSPPLDPLPAALPQQAHPFWVDLPRFAGSTAYIIPPTLGLGKGKQVTWEPWPARKEVRAARRRWHSGVGDCKASSDNTHEGRAGWGASQLETFATRAARKNSGESGYCPGTSR